MENAQPKTSMLTAKSIHILVEAEDGKVYQALVADRYKELLRAIITTQQGEIEALEKPIETIEIEHKTEKNKTNCYYKGGECFCTTPEKAACKPYTGK